MDIKELRIGDLVQYNNTFVQVDIIVGALKEVGILHKDKGLISVPVSELKPILITEELLKEIGFTDYNKENNIQVYEYKYCQYIYYLKCFHSTICDKNDLIYLHQLQHELLDVNKELKVKLI